MIRMWMILLLLAINAPRLAAGEKLPWFEVKDRPNVALLPAGKGEAGPIVKVTGGPEKTTTLVVQLDPAKAPSHRYVLKGRVKYEGVKDVGYLEMLSTFGKNGTFFSRTLEKGGPMGEITGTSDWYDLELPFFSKPGLLPEKIVVNVVLPGKGTVYLTPLTLSAIEPDEAPKGPPAQMPDEAPVKPPEGAWWSGPTAALIGSLGGSSAGLIGAFVGITVSFGFARRFVLTLCSLMIGLGAICLAIGLVALAVGQPYFVWYPPQLFGVALTFVFGVGWPTIRRRYDEVELRKIAALDA
jgi:hypothetical protein